MTTISARTNLQIDRGYWVRAGAIAAVASVAAVLLVQAVATALWPEIALFKPLDSYARTVLFTLVPAVAATALFAWLARRSKKPIQRFVQISAVVLVLSIIPDFLLPVEHKTFLASSVTAFMHVVAAAVIVAVLVISYRRQGGTC
jgi:hypothetical protein